MAEAVAPPWCDALQKRRLGSEIPRRSHPYVESCTVQWLYRVRLRYGRYPKASGATKMHTTPGLRSGHVKRRCVGYRKSSSSMHGMQLSISRPGSVDATARAATSAPMPPPGVRIRFLPVSAAGGALLLPSVIRGLTCQRNLVLPAFCCSVDSAISRGGVLEVHSASGGMSTGKGHG